MIGTGSHSSLDPPPRP